jgi:23S rRNA pseudouridine2605 synthase
MAQERLQKILAQAGLGSRRSCEELITQGRVTVDGATVTELGAKADAEIQTIECDGENVRPARKFYYLLNKPQGVVCTNDDPEGRPRAIDLLPARARDRRLFTVGRLDVATEGLLIVTNDGDFAQRVAHPRHGTDRTYEARVRGAFSNAAKRQLIEGVWILGHLCSATWVKIVHRREPVSVIRITLREGRNREVRRMLARTGHHVVHLRRIRIGDVEDRSLQPGKCRRLTDEEIRSLLGGPGGAPRRRKRKRLTKGKT